MAIGSPGDIAYLAASRVHGRRRVRFIQSPPTAELLTALAGYVESKSVIPVIDSACPQSAAGGAEFSQLRAMAARVTPGWFHGLNGEGR
jgi:hypothetical protein